MCAKKHSSHPTRAPSKPLDLRLDPAFCSPNRRHKVKHLAQTDPPEGSPPKRRWPRKRCALPGTRRRPIWGSVTTWRPTIGALKAPIRPKAWHRAGFEGLEPAPPTGQGLSETTSSPSPALVAPIFVQIRAPSAHFGTKSRATFTLDLGRSIALPDRLPPQEASAPPNSLVPTQAVHGSTAKRECPQMGRSRVPVRSTACMPPQRDQQSRRGIKSEWPCTSMRDRHFVPRDREETFSEGQLANSAQTRANAANPGCTTCHVIRWRMSVDRWRVPTSAQTNLRNNHHE